MIIPAYSLLLHSPSLPWGSSSAVCPPALKRIFRLRSIPPASPPDVSEKRIFLMKERAESTNFFRREPFLYFFAGAEAGPPGKRPEEAKAGNCIGMYKKHFINSRRARRIFPPGSPYNFKRYCLRTISLPR
jgi:hypothetical protein